MKDTNLQDLIAPNALFNITPTDGVTQIRVLPSSQEGFFKLSYRSGDFWLEGRPMQRNAIAIGLKKYGATVAVEECRIETKQEKPQKVDLKGIVMEFFKRRDSASTREVADHLSKPTAVANSVLCSLERLGKLKSKRGDQGIIWSVR